MAESAAHCSCGRVPDFGDSFCARCGSPITDGGNLLIDGVVDDTALRADSVVQHRSRRRWIVAGVVAVGILIFALTWLPGSSAAPEEEESAAAAPQDQQAEVSPSESTEQVRTSEPADPVEEPVATAAPLPGEVSGLGLITTTRGGSLRLTNLGTGELTDYNARGDVVGLVEATAILQSSSGNLEFVDLTKQNSEGAFLMRAQGGFFQVLGVEDDLVWVIQQGADGSVSPIQAFDASGNIVEELSHEDLGVFPWTGDLDLVQNAGGIYLNRGDGPERVSTGFLLASSDRLALIKECDDRMNCQSQWYARPNWDEPIDAPPPVIDGDAQYAIVGDDRWLIQFDWRDRVVDLIEISTGQVVRSMEPPASRFGGFVWPMSPDGRWLLDRTAGGHILVDLESGNETEVDLGDSARNGSALLFIDLATLERG